MITEELAEAAAGNWETGKEAMALHLDQRGTEAKITEEVVEVVAENGRSGKVVVALPLNQCGDMIVK